MAEKYTADELKQILVPDKKEAKRKARIEQRRAKRSISNPKESDEKLMHDIDKPITLEDLTNPDKN